MKDMRVYLSSTFEDLKEHRGAVFAALERAGLQVARMEGYTASDERPLAHCLQDVARCDIYVGLFAWRYGYVPPVDHDNGARRSITELEYRHAEALRLRRLVFLAHPATRADWPARFRDDETGDNDAGRTLDSLRHELGRELSVSFFRTAEELATLVLAAIMRSGLTGRAYSIPARLTTQVSRPAVSARLRDALLHPGGAGAGHVVVHGAAGFGKTSLALDICHDPDVASRFADAMLWTALGDEAVDMARVLGNLYTAVTRSPAPMVGAEAIGLALAAELKGRRSLIVVDDVFRAEDLRPFLRLQDARILVTTRLRNLAQEAGGPGWHEVAVEEMDAAEACDMLARGLVDADTVRHRLFELAARLGRWPLLLDLVNARLLEECKDQPLAAALSSVTELFERRGVLGFDRRSASSRQDAVATSVGVSLEFAERIAAGLARRAIECSIFPEDVAVSTDVLERLWGLDGFATREDVVRPLANLSLLRWDRQAGLVRLHDMVRQALAARLPDPAEVHARLVGSGCDPHHLGSDYAWQWFGWHCIQAGQQPLLRSLLLDLDWLRAKLDAAGINALLADLARLPGDPQVSLVERACRQSAFALASDGGRQLATQLLARLPLAQAELRAQIIRQAGSSRAPWLMPLTPSLAGEPSLRWLRPSGHTLGAVALSADGQMAVHAQGTFGESQDVVRWDLEAWRNDGPQFATWPRRNPFGLALSDDGRWCLYADSIGCVHRLGPGGQHLEGQAHDDLAIASLLAITRDGRRGLSACSRGRLVVWDFEAPTHRVVANDAANPPVALRLAPAGDLALVAFADGAVERVEMATAARQRLFHAQQPTQALAWSRDGEWVALATVSQIELRSVSRPDRVAASFHEGAGATALALSADGACVAWGTADGSVVVRRAAGTGVAARYPRGHTHGVERIAFSRDGLRVVSADRLHFKEWAVAGGVDEAAPPQCFGPARVLPDGTHAVAATDDGRLQLWDLHTGTAQARIEPAERCHAFGAPSTGTPTALQACDAAPRVLTWNARLLYAWDLDRCTGVASLDCERVADACISRDGTQVVFIDGLDVKCWQPDDGSVSLLGSYAGDLPRHVAVSPDGRYALTVGGDREVVVWRLPEQAPDARGAGKRRRPPVRHPGIGYGRRGPAEVSACGVSSRDKPDRVVFAGLRQAVVTSGDGAMFRLDLEDPGNPSLTAFDGPRQRPMALWVRRDGRFVLTSADRLRVWDTVTCTCVSDVAIDRGSIQGATPSLDRALLYSFNGVVQIVSVVDGAVLAAFHADKQISRCDADLDLQRIVGVDQGGQIHLLQWQAPG